MTTDILHKSINDFIEGLRPVDKVLVRTELRIEIQPQIVSFGGDMYFGDGTELPIDLKRVGKIKCRQMVAEIERYHRFSRDEGKNKWNKAIISLPESHEHSNRFIWDEKLEKNEIDAYSKSELERGKWYWEEKSFAHHGKQKR